MSLAVIGSGFGRTVIVADTLTKVTILGLIILIRTFLSFTPYLGIEGRWPWETSKLIGKD